MATPPPPQPPQGAQAGSQTMPPPGAQQGAPPGAGRGQAPPGGISIPIQFPPGQRPTQEQIQAVQRKIAEDAQKAGMSIPQFIEHIKKQAQQRQQMQQQGGGQVQGGPGGPGHQHPHPPQGQGPPGAVRQPITPGPPKPAALAVAKFLRSQNLKTRTCILNGERKDLFKGKWRRLRQR
jgi:translocation protein SEC62